MDKIDVLEHLNYHADTGVFTWKVSQRGPAKAGDVAGYKRADGYVKIKIRGVQMFAHRLVWLVETGSFPSSMIDHIDGNPSNNVFANLRDVTAQINSQNIAADDSCSRYSKLRGAHWNARWKKWKSAISINGKQTHLGWFDTEQDAHAAYIAAKQKHHPGFIMAKGN